MLSLLLLLMGVDTALPLLPLLPAVGLPPHPAPAITIRRSRGADAPPPPAAAKLKLLVQLLALRWHRADLIREADRPPADAAIGCIAAAAAAVASSWL